LKQFRADLKDSGVPDRRMQFYNLEQRQNLSFTRSWTDFFDHIHANLVPGQMNYLFIDEVQNVPEFERLLDALFVSDNLDLYVSGSNAYLLSSELATILSGRQIEIKILPFSFREFLTMTPQYNQNRLQRFLQVGAFPEAVKLSKISLDNAVRYLDSIGETIFQKDVLLRQNLHNRDLIRRVGMFLFDSLGSPISAANISRNLKSVGVEASHHTVQKIIDSLEESYLFYRVPRWDTKGKRILKTLEKYYPVDLGLRNNLLGANSLGDIGHQIETLVYFELVRRYRRVLVGKIDEYEIDFIALDLNNEYHYYQVAYSAKGDEVLARELRSLRKIRDNYPKTLITTDDIERSVDGIKLVNLENWLLG
jgi:predicted AAA+ superfamily ATPase